MAISVETKKGVIHARDGEKLIKLMPESVGDQIKLTTQNGVTQTDVQAELEALHTKVNGLLVSADALQYKGTVNSDGELPTTYEPGWVWKVGTAGTYKGQACEAGDLLISNVSRAGSGNDNSDFDVVQGNVPRPVSGPASATDGNLVSFDQTTGMLVKDSGISKDSVNAAIAFSGKVPSKVVDAVPESMPEDLMPGGMLFVVTPGA